MSQRVIDVQISKYIVDKCHAFAVEQVEGSFNHYKRRNATSKEKIIADIMIGKLGEWGVYKWLKLKGEEVNKPDMKIYNKKNKSFDADLSTGRWDIHCKSQGLNSMFKYGTSWILQYNGRGHGHTDKLFKHRERKDKLAPTVVAMNADGTAHVEIYGIISLQKVFDNDMIKLPACDWFKDTKRAVYWDDLKTLDHYTRWSGL